MSLQTLAKGVQWWRWCNLRWQTVPDLGTSNRKSSVANGGPVECNPSALCLEMCCKETELIPKEKSLLWLDFVSAQYASELDCEWQTDGQTDRLATAETATAIAVTITNPLRKLNSRSVRWKLFSADMFQQVSFSPDNWTLLILCVIGSQ